MAASTWSALTKGLDADDLAKLTAFRDACCALGDVEERVTSSQIAFAGKRTFASAYIKGHYLEVGIELAREVTRPAPRTSFATTKEVHDAPLLVARARRLHPRDPQAARGGVRDGRPRLPRLGGRVAPEARVETRGTRVPRAG